MCVKFGNVGGTEKAHFGLKSIANILATFPMFLYVKEIFTECHAAVWAAEAHIARAAEGVHVVVAGAAVLTRTGAAFIQVCNMQKIYFVSLCTNHSYFRLFLRAKL
jgi:hypothetical protein